MKVDFVSGQQLLACLSRIATEKKRNVRGTMCEYISHFIIIGILVYGYMQAEVKYFAPADYSKINFSITSSSDMFSAYQSIINGPVVVPDINQYLLLGQLFSQAFDGGGSSSLITQTSYGRSFTNILYSGDLHFAPNNDMTRSLVNYLNTTYPRVQKLKVYYHDSEKEGVNYIMDNLGSPAFALIVLRQVSNAKVNYVIRQNYTTLPNSNELIINPAIGLQTQYQDYLVSGFLSLQRAIDSWAYNYTNVTLAKDPTCSSVPNPYLTPYPTYSYNQNIFYSSVGFLLGLAMVMSTMYPMSKLTKSIVEEKETRMRELMKIMGLSDFIHGFSWFLSGFILFFWIAVTSTLLTTKSFLVSSNSFLIFLFFFLFCMAEINFSFLVSVFFSNSKLAAIVAPVILFSTILPRYLFYTTNSAEQVTYKILASILAPTAFSFGADIISSYEYGGVGVQWSNINQGSFNFQTVLIMLWLDFFIYGFLAWYLDKVIPHEMGTAKHPLFIFSWKYWTEGWITPQTDYSDISFDDIPELQDEEKDGLERIPTDSRHLAKIRIKSLGKRYDDGKVAVRNLSLSMLENQITCLLGHNGAGKTTTISMLTGLIQPTAGDALIYGLHLTRNLSEIRHLTGLCPQQNVLFPFLTVEEHLRFFGRLKGLSGAKLNDAVDKVIFDVGLTEKKKVLSGSLSGGMKRKLCLSIALVGDPKFVLLDEPTSGMDVYSRRSTWELLQKSKAGRVILLTTHFMDEADTLADRIAIMSHGTLLCAGSSLYLKSQYGVGYILSLSKMNTEVPVEPIEREIKDIVPAAELKSAVAGEVVVQLPLQSNNFGDLFRMLQTRSTPLGLSSFGISITTLEQVFISLAHKKLENDDGMIHDTYQHMVDVLGPVRTFLRSMIPTRVLLFFQGEQYRRASSNDIEMQLQPRSNPLAIIPSPRSGSPHDLQLCGVVSSKVVPDCEDEDENYDDLVNRRSFTEVKNDGIANGNIFVQSSELYRKRLIVAMRDWKGFFFQIIFPAIQVLLILLILTVSINPAGHTVILNGNMYRKYAKIVPTNLYSTSTNSYSTLPYSGDYDQQHIQGVYNSSAMSKYILNLNNFAPSRYGAYVYNDSIRANVTVDWNFVKQQLTSANLSSTLIKDIAIQFIGLNSTRETSFILFNDSLVGLNLTNLDSTLRIQLPAFLNITLPPLNSSELNQFLKNATRNQQTKATWTLTPDGISVTIGNPPVTTVLIPWSSITPSMIISLLPSNLTNYQFNLASPITIMHNTSSPHGIAAWQGELVETLYQYCSSLYQSETSSASASSPQDIRYLIKNHPLPITSQQTLEIRVVLSLLTAIFILVPLCYIPAAFVAFLVKERVSKSKHLQIVSGVSPYLYWLATYLWDLSLFAVLTGFIMISLVILGKKAGEVFIGTVTSALCMTCLLLTYGAASIPLCYLYSMFFVNFSTAQIAIMVVNFMTGFVMVLAYYIMSSIPKTANAAKVLVHIFRFFPPYNIGEGLINLSTSYYRNSLSSGKVGLFQWDVTGRNLVFLTLEAIGFFLVVLLTEFELVQTSVFFILQRSGLLEKMQPLPPPLMNKADEDVANEEVFVREFLKEGDLFNCDAALVIDNLIKTYPAYGINGTPKFAVRGVSLLCREGERFGLLGINGAGKTTTLGILTSEIQLTSGKVFIGGKSLSDPSTQRMIGYCPQVDPLIDLMTGYETLRFFGKIRGIENAVLERRISDLIEETGLTPYANIPCGRYSGGNKRKLSLAVALIGDPKVLLLDEPSTGMDPEARRHMWNVIEKVSANRTVILVSHSMEEIEALCTRVGVMVSGRMQCLGSVQHLKSKFGGGYLVEVRCDKEKVEECLSFCFDEALKEETTLDGKGDLPEGETVVKNEGKEEMSEECKEARDSQVEEFSVALEERHGGYFRLKVSKGLDLAKAFDEIEKKKKELHIYDYNVSQFSLEQVFINLAKFQEEEPVKHFGGEGGREYTVAPLHSEA